MTCSISSRSSLQSSLLTLLLFFSVCLQAQESANSSTNNKSATQAAAQSVSPPTVAEAWEQLHTAATSKNIDERIQTVTALGLLGGHQEALIMLRKAFDDPEVDVRLAAITAAGVTKDRNLTTDLRSLLDDESPQVAYAAALNLWKMGDHSGEDILLAVMRGERKIDGGMWNEGVHHAKRTLNHPAAIAKFGAIQAGSILLPPVGYGLGAYHYMHGTGEDPRVQALEQVTAEHNNMVRDELITVTDDKDVALRLAAAEKLADYRGPKVTETLAKLFGDSKQEVRLIAYASFIHVSSPATPFVKTKRANP